MFIEFHKLFSPTQLIGATCLFSTLEYVKWIVEESFEGGWSKSEADYIHIFRVIVEESFEGGWSKIEADYIHDMHLEWIVEETLKENT